MASHTLFSDGGCDNFSVGSWVALEALLYEPSQVHVDGRLYNFEIVLLS